MAMPLLLTNVDVRRGQRTGTSRSGIISKVVFPAIKFLKVDSNPGGGVMGVRRVIPRIEPPEPSFSTIGPDEDIFEGLGEMDSWVLAGAYHHPRRGVLPARSILEAAVADWEPDESDPAEFQGCNHTFASVTHFEFHLAGKELWYIDVDERILRRNGVDLFAKYRQAVGA
ncbi:phage major tail tube protein [Shinella sp.]|jgi:phage tail tube protein FII|uniref:phage major tail tube protein n=1 Tax=Shinella sp. TaxID=1870904 RepID=UPI003F6EEFE7